MTRISDRPFKAESNAIHLPSGDHRGDPTTGPPSFVTSRVPRPSLSQTQISSVPVRSETKAILDAAGEVCPARSLRVDEISRVGGPDPAGPAMRNISVSNDRST